MRDRGPQLLQRVGIGTVLEAIKFDRLDECVQFLLSELGPKMIINATALNKPEIGQPAIKDDREGDAARADQRDLEPTRLAAGDAPDDRRDAERHADQRDVR